MPTNLSTNIDASYADDPTAPSRKQHQQDHDVIHSALDALSDVSAPDPYTARAYVDQEVAAVVQDLASLAPVATTGLARSVAGATLEFSWNAGTSKYELVGDVAGTAAALVLGGHRKIFTGPSAQHPKNVTSPASPVFAYGDRFKKVN